VAEPETSRVHVFVYGTLTDADRVSEVLDDADWSFVDDATLRGLHRVDGDYPTLAPGGRVRGRVLGTDAVAALDAYEGVDRGLYVRVAVPVVGRDHDDWRREVDEVAVYMGDPDRLGVADAVAWPGDGEFGERVRRYLAVNDVAVVPR